MTIYFISGQGADQQLFENLVLPTNFSMKYVHWIEPHYKETLAGYVQRLSQQIDATENFVLIGVSLGGIMAVELNKILQPKLTIIISSLATGRERPPHFRFLYFTKLLNILPGSIYKWYNPFVNWYFGAKTKREKELLRYWMKSASKNYMKWSTNEVLTWNSDSRPTNLFHIHGTADKIFLHRFTSANIKIQKGTHLMVHNRASEISHIIMEKLNSITD